MFWCLVLWPAGAVLVCPAWLLLGRCVSLSWGVLYKAAQEVRRPQSRPSKDSQKQLGDRPETLPKVGWSETPETGFLQREGRRKQEAKHVIRRWHVSPKPE